MPREGKVSKKGHIAGGKITATHTTVTEAAKRVVEVAKKIPAIKRVGLGQITPASGGSHRITVKSQEKGAIVLSVRMPKSIQEVTLYTDSVDYVLRELRKKLTIS